MPRPHRIDLPDTWHHVTNRGHNRKDIVRDEDDCSALSSLLAEVTGDGGIQIHAYVFMPNHVHLLVYTPSGGLSLAMKHVMGIYAQRFNAKYGQDGSLWKDRFFSLVVRNEAHLVELPRYIANNPVKAGIVADPASYRYSSHRSLIGIDPPPAFLSTGVVLPVWFNGNSLAYQRFVQRADSDLHRRIANTIEGSARFVDLDNALAPKDDPDDTIDHRLVETIEDFVCRTKAVPRASLMVTRRGQRNVARQAVVTLTYRSGAAPLQAIAERYGMTNRSSVLSIVQRCEKAAETDPRLSELLTTAAKTLGLAAA